MINEDNWFGLITMFESGVLEVSLIQPLFQFIINTGHVWNLQGYHQSFAIELIQDGVCIFGEQRFTSAYGGIFPSRYDLPPGVAGTIEYQEEMRRNEG